MTRHPHLPPMSGNPEAHDYEHYGDGLKQPSLVDRIHLAREGAGVERCHIHPHMLRYSVGHHSLDVVTLVTLTWQAAHDGALPRSELLVAAAFHDIPECVIGDVPSPIKELIGSERLQEAEDTVLLHLGVMVHLTPEERDWLNLCDRLELSLWALEEMQQRGNTTFHGWAACNEKAHAVFQEVYAEMHTLTSRRLTWKELKEAAGL